MRIVAVVQARVRSTRLPAKVLLDLAGSTALERCLQRVRRIPGIDEVVVATSERDEDELITALAGRLGYRCFRGSEEDVLDRYMKVARATVAEAVVRITSDCPLLDPAISGAVVRSFSDAPTDYASNTLERRLPRGLDTEIVSFGALERAHREATGPAREHVTMHLYSHRDRFDCRSVVPPIERDLSHHRWTLDTLDDYRLLYRIFERLGTRAATASMTDVLALFDETPELARINAHIAQKA
jgi:spore coat polysaccharide biosynthesis protein SpsF